MNVSKVHLHVLKEKVKHPQKYSKNVKIVRSTGRLIRVSIMKLQIGCYDLSFFKYLQKIVLILGTGHYLLGGEGYFFFRKVVEKKT